jgi:hypothetical protein
MLVLHLKRFDFFKQTKVRNTFKSICGHATGTIEADL